MSAINVVINQPKRSLPEALGLLAGSLLGFLWVGVVITWLTPIVFDVTIGFWQAVAAGFLLKSLTWSGDYVFWTKAQ